MEGKISSKGARGFRLYIKKAFGRGCEVVPRMQHPRFPRLKQWSKCERLKSGCWP